MKCEDCLNLLTEYIDGEVVEQVAEKIGAHLITCARCSNELEVLTAEQELYTRYDRELDVSPAMWNAIAARTIASPPTVATAKFSLRDWMAGLLAAPRYGFAGAMAVLIVGIFIGVMYLKTQPKVSAPVHIARTTESSNAGSVKPTDDKPPQSEGGNKGTEIATRRPSSIGRASSSGSKRSSSADQSNDVLFVDIAYTELENRDTAEHIQQAQNLLRSIRNIQLSDNDTEVDVTYERAMSRRLLTENVVLRRDAEMSGKFPVKTLLGDLEPFLIDIANLPDKTTPDDLRAIKDRVQKTEIVAALQSY